MTKESRDPRASVHTRHICVNCLRPLQAGGHFYDKLAENYGGWGGGRGREKGAKWKE